jgi:hypothetical protein
VIEESVNAVLSDIRYQKFSLTDDEYETFLEELLERLRDELGYERRKA